EPPGFVAVATADFVADAREIDWTTRRRSSARFDPRELEEIGHDAIEPLHFGPNVRQEPRTGGGIIRGRTFEQLRCAADRSEWRLQFMRKIAHHLFDVGFAFEFLAHLLDRACERAELAARPGLQADIWFTCGDPFGARGEIADDARDVT